MGSKKHPPQNRTNVQIKGGGVKGLLNNVQKNCTFLKWGLPLTGVDWCPLWREEMECAKGELPPSSSGNQDIQHWIAHSVLLQSCLLFSLVHLAHSVLPQTCPNSTLDCPFCLVDSSVLPMGSDGLGWNGEKVNYIAKKCWFHWNLEHQ